MSTAMTILREYLELRHNGVSASQSVETLRARVEGLNAVERAELVRQIREFEQQRQTTQAVKRTSGATGFLNPEAAAILANLPSTPHKIKPLKSVAAADPTPVMPTFAQAAPPANYVTCPHCGKRNREGELFCFSCGHVMRLEESSFDTVRLSDGGPPAGDYFPPNGTIMLVQRGTNTQYKVRPAERNRDLVIGRSDHTVMPDIDLNTAGGDKLSISRIHVSLRHNRQTNTVAAIDMGSANGTYINGQRLYPQEIRTLRHGDELRVGNLTFNVYFVG